MTKSIDTLVPDILSLFDGGTPDFSPEGISSFSSVLSQKIADRVTEEHTNRLRLSNVGKPCKRQLWYQMNVPDLAEPLPPETRVKFLYGDILEDMLLWFAVEAGHTVEGCQDEITVAGIKGHRDAVIDGVTVDVKSASSYSWDKFANGLRMEEDGFGYIPQLGHYVIGSANDPLVINKNIGAFLVIDKTLGKICLDKHDYSGILYVEDIENTKALMDQPFPPERAYSDVPDGKSGNRKLAFQCSYCPFKQTCWENLRTYIYSTGPRFLTKVVREPNVPEAR